MSGKTKIVFIIAVISLIVSVLCIYFYDQIIKQRGGSNHQTGSPADEESAEQNQLGDADKAGD